MTDTASRTTWRRFTDIANAVSAQMESVYFPVTVTKTNNHTTTTTRRYTSA